MLCINTIHKKWDGNQRIPTVTFGEQGFLSEHIFAVQKFPTDFQTTANLFFSPVFHIEYMQIIE